jgi:putative SOS response-associated peptidase YedK
MASMCGRFTIKTPLADLKDAFDVDEVDDPGQAPEARYNVAPSQDVPVVRALAPSGPTTEAAGAARPRRRLSLLRWGLVPFWARDLKIGYRTINARAETVDTTGAFRAAFTRRRCLVLADGFYEWRRVGRARFGYWIRRRDGGPFAMAGLWERWRGPDKALDPPLESCTIITTDANEVVAPIHDRMPVLFDPTRDREAIARWLDPAEQDAAALKPLLRPCPAALLETIPVGTFVNDVRHDGPRCIERFEEPPAAAPKVEQPSLFPGLP